MIISLWVLVYENCTLVEIDYSGIRPEPTWDRNQLTIHLRNGTFFYSKEEAENIQRIYPLIYVKELRYNKQDLSWWIEW